MQRESGEQPNVFTYTTKGYVPVEGLNPPPRLDMGSELVNFTLDDYMGQCPRYDSVTTRRERQPGNPTTNPNQLSPYCISAHVDRVRASPVMPSKKYDIGTTYAFDKTSGEVFDLRKYYGIYTTQGTGPGTTPK